MKSPRLDTPATRLSQQYAILITFASKTYLDKQPTSSPQAPAGPPSSPTRCAFSAKCDIVWSVPDFFATLKHHLKQLHFVPISPRRVVDGFHGPDTLWPEALDVVKGIHRAHGWPDLERYRKKDCLKAILTALCENFPDDLKDKESALPCKDAADA